jgi:hypothetical protein
MTVLGALSKLSGLIFQMNHILKERRCFYDAATLCWDYSLYCQFILGRVWALFSEGSG